MPPLGALEGLAELLQDNRVHIQTKALEIFIQILVEKGDFFETEM